MAEKTSPKGDAPEGDRIAKVLSRRGVASRREAERLIEAGEVKVNGKLITSPALNVTDRDIITISGHPLPALEPARLWLYYKPEGLVTSASDEKGRDTVFDHLPEDMPRVMSVGRLDLNSEGLLLLTNDGELKRRLELPSTGWLRKYRVRVNGNPTDPDLEPLRKGITIDGEKFQPMTVALDRIQGANAWLTVGLREGKNREIRRAMSEIGLTVNRLIRVSYGPFRLDELKPGEVEEVKARVLKDQLGEGRTDDGADPAARKPRPTTRRLRPGDGVKALAKAWDEATAPAKPAPRGRAADGDKRPKAPSDRDEPRGPRPPRTSAAKADDAAPRRFGTAKTRSVATSDRDEPRSPRPPRSSAPKGDDAAPRRFGTARSKAASDRDEAPKPRTPRAPAAKDKPASTAARKPVAGAGAGRTIAGPRKSAPKPTGKPPTSPRKPR